MDNCVFCKIIRGELPACRVYENERVLAFLDIRPINSGHVLIIPKIHKEFIHELDDATVGELMAIANRVNRALRASGLRCEGVNYFLADGAAAFQEVPHTHLHCIPRFQDDGFSLKFPEAYYGAAPTRQDLDALAATIRRCL